MTPCARNLNEIYALTKLLSCNEIKLVALGRNHDHEVLVLYNGNGDFVYHNLNLEDPVIKRIPWFKDSLHSPNSIDFSPSGCFLLILSEFCHLYILPVCSVFTPAYSCDLTFDASDLTIHTYPFNSKGTKRSKCKTKSPNQNQSFDLLSQSTSSSNNVQSSNTNSSQTLISCLNDNESKLKEISCSKHNVFPSAVCWWQSSGNSLEVGIIGTKSGDIIFVDLTSGIKIGETSIRGNISELSICQDATKDNSFLLITVDNGGQYKLTLEQNQVINNILCGKQSSGEDGESEESSQTNNWNSHTTRTRLQGLKQMSAGKLSSIKLKIAETRSKMSSKQGITEKTTSKISGNSAENIGSILGETVLSRQIHEEETVLAGYYANSQLLTVHSMNLELVPRFVHKMPIETEKVLLCDRVIYIISGDGRSLQVVSSKLTETQIKETSEFNLDSVLGKWNFDDGEFILSIRKIESNNEGIDHWRIGESDKERKQGEEHPVFGEIGNCVVVTNKNVYAIHSELNLVKIVLDLILETHDLEKAERICTIYGINFQKLLEMAGDVKLSSLEFPTAIALYKLSKCGLLKSIVKLACGSHCSQVLNYSLMLMSNSISEMSLTEKIHLSNLILMTYTQQILKNENNKKLLENFTDFLQTNTYYDEVLGVSITGQSLLFACLRKLMTHRGLIAEGYSVLTRMMERFGSGRIADWNLNRNEFWECATESDLIEAIVFNVLNFSTYSNYVSRHLGELDGYHLDRLLFMLDPTSACLRPLARAFDNFRDSAVFPDENQTIFPFEKLVELFLLALLAKLYDRRDEEENYRRDFLMLALRRRSNSDGLLAFRQEESFESAESLCDEIWPIRKSPRALGTKELRNRPDSVLSCGYGHTALIRNGSVYTWGQTARGCLGQGPTMSRYAPPTPVSWLTSFKLEVFSVACGKNHTAILTDNGVYTWGCSRYGQLGLGEIAGSPHPRLVNALANETVVGVACGQFHTLALTDRGTVFAWGWGVHGQLGLGSVDDERRPKWVEALKEHVIVEVAAGHGHSLVLSDKGHVYSFGSGVFGQLGTGTTAKRSTPVHVKGMNGRIVTLATGYFHSLALTESNALYTWGSSPQCLRFQAQARKKSKLLQSPHSTSRTQCDFESLKSPAEENRFPSESPSDEIRTVDVTQSESHLSPSLVDTNTVTGKIVQISCGCHHSALVTDSGGLYTWGRSPEGQLGLGGNREIRIPTQINEKTFRVDHISCGFEFTSAQEKHTGKIYTWGSNSVGQLAMPIKESATKSLDGKLVMLKTCKRIVRLMDRNSGSNSSNVPKEISQIPLPAFTYRLPLRKTIPNDCQNLSILDPGYSQRSFHLVAEKFSHCINLDRILDKSLEYKNYQVASKVALLRSDYKQSIVYQLKALQNVPKYRANKPEADGFEEEEKEETEASPDDKIQSFPVRVQVRPEQTENSSRNRSEAEENAMNSRKDSFESTADDGNWRELKMEFVDHAGYIIDSYLNLNSAEKLANRSIIETGIRFWTAEKLPMNSLENLFFDRLDEIFYDLGYLLFCQKKGGKFSFLKRFSSSFLFAVTSRILNLIENNGCLRDYLEIMSRILAGEKSDSSRDDRKRRRERESGREEIQRTVQDVDRSDQIDLDSIGENLRDPGFNLDHVKISFGDVSEEKIYFFSCGHFHSSRGLNEEFKIFEDLNDDGLKSNLIEVYEKLIGIGRTDLACPACVRNHLR